MSQRWWLNLFKKNLIMYWNPYTSLRSILDSKRHLRMHRTSYHLLQFHLVCDLPTICKYIHKIAAVYKKLYINWDIYLPSKSIFSTFAYGQENFLVKQLHFGWVYLNNICIYRSYVICQQGSWHAFLFLSIRADLAPCSAQSAAGSVIVLMNAVSSSLCVSSISQSSVVLCS